MAQNYYLMHHGVKGMKWGVRRTPEQLGYRPSGRRTASAKAALGKSTMVAKRFASSSSTKVRNKMSDPDFQRKVATGAKIALAIGVIYAGHKLANNPQAIQAGKDILTGVLGKTGTMKTSMLNSTEAKVAKATLGLAKKGLKGVASENFRNTVTGVGAMATTAAVLKGQIKDLRENKPDGDSIDKALEYTKKMTEIGENINNLAQGPSGAKTPSQGSNSSNNSSSSSDAMTIAGEKPSHKGVDKNSKEYQDLFKGESYERRSTIKSLVKGGYDVDQIKKYMKHSSDTKTSTSSRGNLMEDSKTGKVVKTNRQLTVRDTRRISDYRKSHPNKSLEDVLNDLDLLDKNYVDHSAIRSGWCFNQMAGCRYIF